MMRWSLQEDPTLQDVRFIIDHMYLDLPLLRELCGKRMARNDWAQIMLILKAPPQTDLHKISLHMLDEFGLHTNRPAVCPTSYTPVRYLLKQCAKQAFWNLYWCLHASS
jgi:hypothetical protein